MTEKEPFASFTWNGKEYSNIRILNPFAEQGKTWLAVHAFGQFSDLLIVEASNEQEVIEELLGDSEWSTYITMDDDDAAEMDQDDLSLSDSGIPLCLDNLIIEGDSSDSMPFLCLYHNLNPSKYN